MPAQYELSDDSVVVVIGSGAGGGTLANELALKGIDVVCLEGRLDANSADQFQNSIQSRFGKSGFRHPIWSG